MFENFKSNFNISKFSTEITVHYQFCNNNFGQTIQQWTNFLQPVAKKPQRFKKRAKTS